MREISIPLSLNEEMKAGHYDAQIKSKQLDMDDLVCGKRSKGRSSCNARNGYRKSQFNAWQCEKAQGYQSLCIMHVPGLR